MSGERERAIRHAARACDMPRSCVCGRHTRACGACEKGRPWVEVCLPPSLLSVFLLSLFAQANDLVGRRHGGGVGRRRSCHRRSQQGGGQAANRRLGDGAQAQHEKKGVADIFTFSFLEKRAEAPLASLSLLSSPTHVALAGRRQWRRLYSRRQRAAVHVFSRRVVGQ